MVGCSTTIYNRTQLAKTNIKSFKDKRLDDFLAGKCNRIIIFPKR